MLLNDSMCSNFSKKCHRLFHWGPLMTLWIIFLVGITSLRCALQMLLHPGIVLFISICFLIYLILHTYFLAVFVGPGFVPYGWTPKNSADQKNLQFCFTCNGFKPPRAHHCNKCRRCVLKMDHHCPWLNTCCGHLNHGYFVLFLITAPIGCTLCSIALSINVYHKLIMFPFFTFDYIPNILFVIIDLCITLFSLGMAIGVTLAVGILAVSQLKSISRNQTAIETWIVAKARIWRKELGVDKPFCYPYDLGRSNNFRQVFTWSGRTVGDGFTWPVKEGCGEYDLTLEQIYQKQLKEQSLQNYYVIHDYRSRCFSYFKYGFKTELCTPCYDEPKISVNRGDLIQVSRTTKYWLYGHVARISDKAKNNEMSGKIPRGWIPRACLVEAEKFKTNGKSSIKRKDD